MFDALRLDLRYAVRSLRRTPLFTVTAVLCLAVGIAVNTSTFSFLNALLFRDFPGVVAQNRLVSVSIGTVQEGYRGASQQVAHPDYVALRDGMRSVDGVAAVGRVAVAIGVSGEPAIAVAEFVSGNYFSVLGTRPSLGRFTTPADDQPGAPSVVVVSYDFWRRSMGASPAAVGQVISIGAHPFTVIGVTPQGFFGTQPTDETIDPERGALDAFVPLTAAPMFRPPSRDGDALTSLEDNWLRVIARLPAAGSEAAALAEAGVVAARFGGEHPVERPGAYAEFGSTRGVKPSEIIAGVMLIMSVPLLILLVACANLANQLLARATVRGREVAVRMSLGATRGRLVRQLLSESQLIAVLGGVGGVLLSMWAEDLFAAFGMVLTFPIPVDARVLAFGVLLAMLTGALFGLVPALHATRRDLVTGLKSGGPGAGYRHSRLRSGLIITQVAASLTLLTLTGVFMRSAGYARGLTLGFDPDRLISAGVNLDLVGYTESAGRAFQARAMDQLAALPGVVSVAMTPVRPFGSVPEERAAVPGDDARRRAWIDVLNVQGDWLGTTGAVLIRGRSFDATEMHGVPRSILVDEAAAKQFWGTDDPIGRTLRVGDDSIARTLTVVGLIRSVRTQLPQAPEGLVVVPGGTRYEPTPQFLIRTRGNPDLQLAAVRRELQRLAPDLPLRSIRTMREMVGREIAPVRQLAAGLGAAGAVALLLAMLGLYAVLSFIVAQRRFEIGVRMALGAGRGNVIRLVLRQALTMTGFGIAVGAPVAAGVTMLFRSLLFGLSPFDPLAFVATATLCMLVALCAGLAPARRATRVEPMVVLRNE